MAKLKYYNGSEWVEVVGGSSSTKIGDIKYFAVSPPDTTWLECDGSLVKVTDYPDLYSLLDVTYTKNKLYDVVQRTLLSATFLEWIGEVNGLLYATHKGIAYSTDGVTWTPCTFTDGVTTTTNVTPMKVVYGNGVYVAPHTTGYHYSTDGKNWIAKSNMMPSGEYLNAIVFANGEFYVGGGGNGNGAKVYKSTDGLTWTKENFPLSSDRVVAGLYYTGSQIVATYATNNALATSTGSGGWTVVTPDLTLTTAYRNFYAYDGYLYMVTAGTVFRTKDIKTWTTYLENVGNADSLYVADNVVIVGGTQEYTICTDYQSKTLVKGTFSKQYQIVYASTYYKGKVHLAGGRSSSNILLYANADFTNRDNINFALPNHAPEVYIKAKGGI